MPVHEKHYINEDTTDLVTDTVKTGITGAAGGILADVGDTPPAERAIGEAAGIDRAATPTATDSVTATSIDVVVAVPTGATKLDILVVDANGEFVSRTEDADGTVTIDAGATGDYTVYARGVDDDGRVGPWSAGDAVTVA